jgi:hypothetical protein
MATSGTTAFDPNFTEIAEEAWERAGKEMSSGYQLRTARRSMNLMMVEWQNKGINMWTIDEGTIPLVQGTATYTLPADTIDLLDHVIRTGSGSSQQDINISRISVSNYASIPNKEVQARPIQLYINRLRDAPEVTVWPIPNNGNYTLQYWRMRRIEDVGTGVNTADMTFRFLPALVAGLAYYIAMKMHEFVSRLPMLKEEYVSQFQMAESEDREKATLRIVPRLK